MVLYNIMISFRRQQVALPLSQLSNNAFHSLKTLVNSAATSSLQRLQKYFPAEPKPSLQTASVSLRELGSTQLEELVSRLMPTLRAKEAHHIPAAWRTTHVSADTFFQNKHGFSFRTLGLFGSPTFYRQYHSPPSAVCSELQRFPVWIQHRGFNTLLSSRIVRLGSSRDGPVDIHARTFMKRWLMTERKGPETPSLDQELKPKNRIIKEPTMALICILLVCIFIIGIHSLWTDGTLAEYFNDYEVNTNQIPHVTFEHVKGVDEARKELQDVVEYLRNPQKFSMLGGKLPKGILLVGPPGTGKTLLARAMAGEAGVPFYYASGSEFDEINIRKLFKKAKAQSPCVIFIDELDSVGGERINSQTGHTRQTINQLLAEMDGFVPNDGIIVIGATNTAELLDKALVRPGRFDVKVTVPIPDVRGRTDILNWYLSKVKADPAVDAQIIARGTGGFSGAELENLVNKAALKAAADNKLTVTMKDLEFAKDKIRTGPETIQIPHVTFEHVKGVDEAKNELQDVVEYLRNPHKFSVLGGKLPKGILLVGPPGTGKTLLARAVAGEAGVPFYYASGSEFDEVYVGVGAKRIRELFKKAKAQSPCVIFIDELDSVGGERIHSQTGHTRQTINQLLAEMDGFIPNEGIIVIGATNTAELLDKALVRPGRFDVKVTVPIPDVRGRTDILKWYLSKVKADPAVDEHIIARGTGGFSGAELENLVNKAALKAAADNKLTVTMKDLEFAKNKIRTGPETIQIPHVTFEHVKGVDEAKNELQDVVEYLRNPHKFSVLGGKLPKGILLVGPPGTGKTLLARAVAGEAGVPFYYASGSEFDEVYVGVGASRIRELFKRANAQSPCVIFIDELDSVGGERSIDSHSRQTINQLLAEMDGFVPNEGIIVIGATNTAELLDKALVRPGRFDVQVTVPIPDVRGRTDILKWYLSKVIADPAVDEHIIARGTSGFSGAELENLVNQAALKAATDNKLTVTMKDLEFAKDKILMGPERKSVQIDKKNKAITAYHESGHAIVALYTKDATPVHKATIMPRGSTLGHVSLLPEDDRWHLTRAQLLADMDVSMGGRVAEELIFGEDYVTTGAYSDLDRATNTANMMVTRVGMSDKLGVMTYADPSRLSPERQAAIEQEVSILLKDSYERAKSILKTYSKEHKMLAEALLTHETLDAKQIQSVLDGKLLGSS